MKRFRMVVEHTCVKRVSLEVEADSLKEAKQKAADMALTKDQVLDWDLDTLDYEVKSYEQLPAKKVEKAS